MKTALIFPWAILAASMILVLEGTASPIAVAAPDDGVCSWGDTYDCYTDIKGRLTIAVSLLFVIAKK